MILFIGFAHLTFRVFDLVLHTLLNCVNARFCTSFLNALSSCSHLLIDQMVGLDMTIHTFCLRSTLVNVLVMF